ncbi:DUF5752 family protein [Methylococcus sp. EFPC2]|uniref:DUF5752 family protein n=1 Tax=Methylococcus sp. EFPC2 TaxID=2812648 RepID=UPI001967977D|nr:DUF5752 family protein [Methylococcus sp. EFPC2]QSA98176.1 hypothetical protein JWZ97_04990 [Methylococcus sp. EFPC2]
MPAESVSTVDVSTDENVFQVRDCTLIAIATGTKAATLKEFRDGLQVIHPGSIYYHFWGGLLQSRFEEREYNNDFAAWAQHGLHDAVLGERLAAVDPTDFEPLEDLRRELIEIIEERLDESERLTWLVANRPFEFLQSQIIVFDTRTRVAEPKALAQLMLHLSIGTVFYHFIDARRRSPIRVDDFSAWLAAFGGRFDDLARQLAGVDPYFGSLGELRQRLANMLSAYFGEGG